MAERVMVGQSIDEWKAQMHFDIAFRWFRENVPMGSLIRVRQVNRKDAKWALIILDFGNHLLTGNYAMWLLYPGVEANSIMRVRKAEVDTLIVRLGEVVWGSCSAYKWVEY